MNHTPVICRGSEEPILHATDKRDVLDIRERSKHSYQLGKYEWRRPKNEDEFVGVTLKWNRASPHLIHDHEQSASSQNESGLPVAGVLAGWMFFDVDKSNELIFQREIKIIRTFKAGTIFRVVRRVVERFIKGAADSAILRSAAAIVVALYCSGLSLLRHSQREENWMLPFSEQSIFFFFEGRGEEGLRRFMQLQFHFHDYNFLFNSFIFFSLIVCVNNCWEKWTIHLKRYFGGKCFAFIVAVEHEDMRSHETEQKEIQKKKINTSPIVRFRSRRGPIFIHLRCQTLLN